MEKVSNRIFKILDIVICICIIILSIKKGGFYTKDTLWFNIITSIIALIYFIIKKYISLKNKSIKFDIKNNIIYILVFLLPISYLLPIIFNKTTNISDSFYEMIRYLNFSLIFLVVSISKNKKYYINTIIFVSIIQVFLGIDGLALRLCGDIFKNLNSGYLNIDFDRLSGTIQYANVTSIIFAISLVILIDKFLLFINNKEENNLKQEVLNILIYISIFWLFSSIILTESRAVLLVFIITLIIYSFINKEKLFHIIYFALPQIILSLIYTSYINKYLLTNQIIIYYTFLICTIICILVALTLIKNINILNKIHFNKNNTIKVLIFLFVFLIIYTLISLNISRQINIDSKSRINYIEKSIYGFNLNSTNTIEISIDEKEVDTRYYFTIYEEDTSHNLKYLARFDYFNTTSGNFTYVFTPNENAKRLNIYLQCTKGNIAIDSVKLNKKNYILDYVLIPSDYVYRIYDMLSGSTSTSDRIEYIKDSLKLIQLSPIIGIGGEGFKNNYKEVQSVKYSSTEAHNSILQVFVESGIIGGTILISIILIVLLKTKYNTLKLIFIMFVFHSIIDLNFSYMLLIVFFAILSSYTEYNKK